MCVLREPGGEGGGEGGPSSADIPTVGANIAGGCAVTPHLTGAWPWRRGASLDGTVQYDDMYMHKSEAVPFVSVPCCHPSRLRRVLIHMNIR